MTEDFESFKYQTSLLVRSNSVALDDFERVLQIPPRVSWRVGELMTRGTSTTSVRSNNYCSFNFEIDLSLAIEDNIRQYLNRLSQLKHLITQIRNDRGTLVLAVTWYAGQGRGYEFCSDFLMELGRLHIDLGIEVFSPTA